MADDPISAPKSSQDSSAPAGSAPPGGEAHRFSPEEIEALLTEAEIEGGELVPQGSNYTFVVRLCSAKLRFLGIYKPADGERPLWDFPYGNLHFRERCSFLVSEALGWHLVPPTVIREGPHGEGSVQLFISHSGDSNYFSLREEGRPELFLLAVFDFIVNNTDRKGGHCFVGKDGRVWGIDHGLTFHAEPKLRTVIWDFSGQALPENILGDLRKLDKMLGDAKDPLIREMCELLDGEEIEMFRRRVRAFLDSPRLPRPEEYQSFPWPPV